MNRQIANEMLKNGETVDITSNIYMFKSNGIKSRYPKNTYVVRYFDREETFTNFRKAYSFAYSESKNNYVSIASNW